VAQRRPPHPGRPTRRVKDARTVALDALGRIDEGAYANLVLPALLERSGLAARDRGFVTELVYGTTRMRRALDHVVDGYLLRPVEPSVRNVLRLGAYQLVFLGTPAHAGVSATVEIAPRRARGLVNAVLRKVAAAGAPAWPDDATRLSYPDWIVERLVADLGRDDAIAALEQMNLAAEVHERDDGYVQDPASQQVAAAVGAGPGETVADLCAAPGGKATAMAATGATVVALDVSPARAGLVVGNSQRLGATGVLTGVADATHPPLRPGRLDRVLVDAPCSGLGVLRRRADARWRVQPADVDELAALQRSILDAAHVLLRPGGTLVYSVCTLSAAETTGVDEWMAATLPHLEPDPPPPAPWRLWGRGGLLLPQDEGTDGMFLLRLRAPS
jgi:16S rRNA (cytosine967-C5)-methyltransferase